MTKKVENDLNKRAERLSITGIYTTFAFISGMRYPSPRWFGKVPLAVRTIWVSYFRVNEIMLLFLLISNFVLIATSNYIGVRTECVGSIAFTFISTYKYFQLYRLRSVMDKVVSSLHSVADQLNSNPVGNGGYLALHEKNFGAIRRYSIGKYFVSVVPCILLTISHIAGGIMAKDPSKRITPMLGWFPFDFNSRPQFVLACLMQLGYYTMLLSRDITADMVMLTILGVVNNQLVFLGTLLGDVLDCGPRLSPRENHKLLGWWIKQHHDIISIVQEYKKICTPLLFATYAYVSFIFFLALLRLTEDDSFVLEQQVVLIGINCGNLIHLYVISSLGDDISLNSSRIALELDRESLWSRSIAQIRSACIISTRCYRPIQMVFADNRVLAVKSFSEIMESLLSYFVTIYQLRN